MSLFITVSCVLFCLVAIAGGLIGLINYTVNKAKKSREEQLAMNHDKLIQEKHFLK